MKSNKRWLKWICLGLACGMALTSMSGCSGNGDDSTDSQGGSGNLPVIRFATNYMAGTEQFHSDFSEMVEAYAASVKDKYTVEFESESGDNLRDKIKTDLAADNLPDCFHYWTAGSVKDMVDNNLLLDIDEYFAVSKNLSRDNYPESSLGVYTFDGKTYGFPIEGSSNYMLYNKEIFDEKGLTPPTNMDELLEVSKALSADGIVPLAVGSSAGNPAHFWYAAVFYQYYTQEESNTICGEQDKWLGEDNIVKTGNLIEQMRDAGTFPADTLGSGDFAPAVSMYNEEKAAMIYAFPWVIQQFTDEIVEKSEFMDVPVMPDAKYSTSDFVVGGTNFGFVVNAKSFHDESKQAALVDFVDYLLGDEVNQLVAESGRWAVKIQEYDESKLNPLYVRAQEYLDGREERVHLWSNMPAAASQEVFSYAMDELWAGSATVDQINQDIQDSINSDLS